MNRLVVFSDLDGTLLSHLEYDWSAAGPALAALEARGIPLVLASSKTRAEIEAWRERLDNHDPFISENGGALYAPIGSTPAGIAGAERVGDYERVRFGVPYVELREALPRLAEAIGVGLRGFGDMTLDEIEALTRLDRESLALAAQREHDEPFVAQRPLEGDEYARLKAAAVSRGLKVVRGGLLYHLLGPNSKGAAARLLIEAYRAGGVTVETMALGDGANDLELLEVSDHPVVIARPDGSHSRSLASGVPHARFTRGVGPTGFNEAVLEWLARHE